MEGGGFFEDRGGFFEEPPIFNFRSRRTKNPFVDFRGWKAEESAHRRPWRLKERRTPLSFSSDPPHVSNLDRFSEVLIFKPIFDSEDARIAVDERCLRGLSAGSNLLFFFAAADQFADVFNIRKPSSCRACPGRTPPPLRCYGQKGIDLRADMFCRSHLSDKRKLSPTRPTKAQTLCGVLCNNPYCFTCLRRNETIQIMFGTWG